MTERNNNIITERCHRVSFPFECKAILKRISKKISKMQVNIRLFSHQLDMLMLSNHEEEGLTR